MWLSRAVSFSAVAAAMGCAVVGSCNWLILQATRERIVSRVEDVPPRPVAIVLGAAAYPDGPSPVLRDRLEVARELYESGRVERILVTGDHRAHTYDEVNTMYRWLREHGVPEGDVFLDHAGFRTLDSMQRAARVFDVHAAVVCTQRFHLPRALWLAQHAGIDAIGLAADRHDYTTARKDALREMFARTIAVGDVHLWRREPAVLGPHVPIDGDARASHDAHTGR